ncbi:MAG TPA: cytochrome c biogenesis protein ResB [Candidatus Binatia bacterium]|nr:cytochrome c biogenesis protein ResB [Candidatus Binatia bacterium]
MVEKVLKFFNSLKLTVVLLALGLVLVFIGTLAQVDEGLYQAQTRYFKSWFIYSPTIFGTKVPIIFPGGYFIGTLLLVNLVVTHVTRFPFTKKKIGIHLIHGGIVLLLLGQLLTDALSTESAIRFAEGDSRNYSEDFHASELVLIDTSKPNQDRVVAIPEGLLENGKEIREVNVPVTLRIREYWPNSWLLDQPTNNSVQISVSQGLGSGLHLLPLKPTVSMEQRNIPSAIVEVATPQGSLGTWLVSSQTAQKQEFRYQNKTYQLAMRFKRYYKPFNLTLLRFAHDRYRGTDIPKNFASRVQIQRASTGENREVEISMNKPLRYNGETFYQAGFDEHNDERERKITILQVVHNPSWLTPYFSCVLVALGMIVQFASHLLGFAKRRSA